MRRIARPSSAAAIGPCCAPRRLRIAPGRTSAPKGSRRTSSGVSLSASRSCRRSCRMGRLRQASSSPKSAKASRIGTRFSRMEQLGHRRGIRRGTEARLPRHGGYNLGVELACQLVFEVQDLLICGSVSSLCGGTAAGGRARFRQHRLTWSNRLWLANSCGFASTARSERP